MYLTQVTREYDFSETGCDIGLVRHVRDRSLITVGGGLQNGKIVGPKLFATPPQDRV